MTAVNLLPALDSATESALRESIKRFGVLVPVIYDQDNNLVDGHHRVRLAKEVGCFVPVSYVRLPTTEPERSEALADVNDARRQRMSVEQRRQIVGHLRSEGHSTRAIAGAVGVAQSTVVEDTKASGDQHRSPERVTGEDGKSYPAKREKSEDAPPPNRTWKRDPADLIGNIITKVEGVTTPLGNRRDGETKDQLIDVGAAIIASDEKTLREWTKALDTTIQRLTRLRTGIKGGL